MPNAHVMQCMEIWGGNRRIVSNVAMPGLDAWVYSRPFAESPATTAESGGDIHYLSSCATGRITRMVIADVSGHGEAIAAVASSLRRLMGKFSNYIDQRKFVAAVNQRFNALHDEGDTFAGLFATAVVATYFAPTDALTLSNAGHPRPLWFDSRAGRWRIVDVSINDAPNTAPSNLPLGVLDATPYSKHTITLAEQDLVLIYTDVLLEIRDPRGQQLGEQGLLRLLSSIGATAAADFTPQLLAALADFAGLTPDPSGDLALDDDITILLLKRNADKPRPSPMLSMRATARIIGRAAKSVVDPDHPAAFPEFRAESLLGAISDRFHKR